MSKRFPGRRLSLPRLAGVLVVVLGLVFVGFQGWNWFADSSAAAPKPWTAGYVDVTATPNYAFENPATPAGRNVVLSFIVADKSQSCTPSWGTYYSLGQADVSLDIDRRIARRTQQGGAVIVSFGGQANRELATACTNADSLKKAYASVIDRYRLSTIDLDLEGANLADQSAAGRRATALAAIQKSRAGTRNPLAIWLTLPVAPTGLSSDGTTAVSRLIGAGVDLAGVNVMTMDYGDSLAAGQSMADASIAALKATHGQLDALYRQHDIKLSAKALWSKIGVTPMIGQNDVADEVFSLDDARTLNAFAATDGLGRMSMWSLNRDTTCGSNYPDVKVVSDSCSGVAQGDLRFADVLGASMTGNPSQAAGRVTASEPTRSSADLKDDPATSPYPIWDENIAYPKDTKIVWHHSVYVSKYWTQGDVPDNPVLQASETPWQLVGPVLPGEKPVAVPTLPAGTYPEWQGTTVYTKGARVLFEDRAYEAKWWTQGDSPDASSANPDSSPWQQLSDNEIRRVLGQPSVGAGDGGIDRP